MKERLKTQTTDKNTVLFIATFASFLTPFMGSAINIALPVIGKEFNANAVLLSWVASSYLLAAAMFLVPFGRMADIIGRKRIFFIGIVIFSIASLLSAFSQSVIILIVFRIFQGIGSAMLFGTGIAIIISVFPLAERGKALGINIAAVYIGLSAGPFAGGFLTQHLGWRSIFLVIVPVGLIIILVLTKLKEEWAEAKGEHFDWKGAIIYGISLALIMYGFSVLPEFFGCILIFLGIIGITAFIKLEITLRNPVLDMRLFKNNRVFAFSNLAAMINYSATFAVAFLLSLYLQYIKGFSPQKAGVILIAQPIVMAVFSPIYGRLSDKIEPRIVASVGMTLTTLGLFFFIFLTDKTGTQAIIANLILLGLGFSFFSSPNTNAVMSSVEKKFYGVASGTIGTMRLVGQMLSMGIAMLIFSLFIGRQEISAENFPQFLKSIKVAFIIFSIICFGGIFASLSRGKIR